MKLVEDMILDEIEISATPSEKAQKNETNFNWDRLLYKLNTTFPIEFKREELTAGVVKNEVVDIEALAIQIADRVGEVYKESQSHLMPEQLNGLERFTVLSAIDALWQEHLYTMDQLRSSIYLRTYAQKDPLVEYKNEAFNIFEMMMRAVRRRVAESMFRIQVRTVVYNQDDMDAMPIELDGGEIPPEILAALQEQGLISAEDMPAEMPAEEVPVIQPAVRMMGKIGANDPCPCGSGKKYKKCCGK